MACRQVVSTVSENPENEPRVYCNKDLTFGFPFGSESIEDSSHTEQPSRVLLSSFIATEAFISVHTLTNCLIIQVRPTLYFYLHI